MWTVSGLLHGEILPVCQQRGWKVNDESDIRTAAGEVILDNAYLWLKDMISCTLKDESQLQNPKLI